jgi:D-3-phosphoglycerate dehydrogenase / 2-oxoglutarate reductase
MNRPKVYVTDSEFPDYNFEEQIITEAGGELIGLQCKTENEIITHCKDAVGIIDQYAQITRNIMSALPKLKIVSRMGIGVNTIDLDAATQLGIYVGNVPDGSVEEVSNHAFSMLMALMRKLYMFDRDIRHGGWGIAKAMPIYRPTTQKLGLMGFGRIPQRLAEKAAVLGFQTIAYDPFLSGDFIKSKGSRKVTFEELIEESDFISVHTPLTKETKHIVNAEVFKNMKKTAYIINTSRGSVIDETALINALQSEQIAGAGLDVYEIEPIAQNNQLLKLNNVILSSHAAWYSEEALIDIRTKTAQNVADVLQGKQPRYLVNKELADK